MKFNIINLTGETVAVAGNDYPPSEKVAKIKYATKQIENCGQKCQDENCKYTGPYTINGVPVHELIFIEIVNLPEKTKKNTFYIVSPEVLNVGTQYNRLDLLSVHNHPNIRKDDRGVICVSEFIR